MQQRVSLITLGTRDMAAQAAFYEALGFEPFHLYDEARIADGG